MPRSLTRKRDELAYERAQLKTRLAEVEAELKALDYALKVVSPEWEPSKRKPRAPTRPRRLLRGQVATTCLQVLRRGGALSTPEIVRLVAQHLSVTFENTEQRDDFASSVTMALRRYERKGLVEIIDQDARTGAFHWRLSTGQDGRVVLLRGAS